MKTIEVQMSLLVNIKTKKEIAEKLGVNIENIVELSEQETEELVKNLALEHIKSQIDHHEFLDNLFDNVTIRNKEM